MDPKRIKFSEWSECCVCGDGGFQMTDVFNLALRENETVVSSFSDILKFALELNVQIGASDICANCKQKSIEFYHFKRKAKEIQKQKPLTMINHSIPPNVSSLAQDSMRIVDQYIKKFSIKALRIEESDEKLIIMRKPSNEKTHEPENIPALLIKQEPVVEDSCVKVKIEPDLIIEDIEEDSMESQTINSPNLEQPDEKESSAINSNESQQTNLNQIDMILNMNHQIFQLVQELNSKVENLGNNLGRIGEMYESNEYCEPSGD